MESYLTLIIIIILYIIINFFYRKSNLGLIISDKKGRGVIIKRNKKMHLAARSKSYFKNDELSFFNYKGKKYIIDFWSIFETNDYKIQGKLNIFEYIRMKLKFRSFNKNYEDLIKYLLGPKYEYLQNGFYFSFGYKRYNEKQVITRTEKEIEKTILKLINILPKYKKEYELILSKYNKKQYSHLIELISLIDLTGKELFGAQIFSRNNNKNMYQVIEDYGSVDYYAFIIDNPIVCSKRSKLLSDKIINRHRLVHDLYKKYYTKDNYVRMMNLLICMVKVHETKFDSK